MNSTVLDPRAGPSLVEQTVAYMRGRVDAGIWRAGTRVPSIREQARLLGISRFTVVEAYDRLVAEGLIESRRGSGFYVRAAARAPLAAEPGQRPTSDLDIVWLLRNMLNSAPAERSPGMGYLPAEAYDPEMLSTATRSVARAPAAALVETGSPEGHLPLREALVRLLAELNIDAPASQIITATGITQVLDLVAREFTRPGDAVLVEDPAWFLMFGRFARSGLRVLGVPRLHDGPDLDALERLAVEHRPKLLVINSHCHNPTGSMLSAACAYRLLRLAEQHDFLIVEDDIYGDFLPPAANAVRLAALDQLRRVIFCSGFSKTLSPGLRVGYAAASREHAQRLAEQKMLSVMTTPSFGERVVEQILVSGHYRKHVQRLRQHFDTQRPRALRALERCGVRIPQPASAGLFLWADMGRDTQTLAILARDAGFVTAPGALFSPSQAPSTRMRFNILTSTEPALLRWLAEVQGGSLG